MSPVAHRDSMQIFEYQSPALLNRVAPVQNTWYDILPATDECRVYRIGVNIATVGETLEVQAIVDGVTIPAQAAACVFNTAYFGTLYADPIAQTDEITLVAAANIHMQSTPLFDGDSVQIQVRKTTAAGAGNLMGIVLFGTLLRT